MLHPLGYSSGIHLLRDQSVLGVLRPTVFKMIDPILFKVKQCSLSRAIIGRRHTEDSARQKS